MITTRRPAARGVSVGCGGGTERWLLEHSDSGHCELCHLHLCGQDVCQPGVQHLTFVETLMMQLQFGYKVKSNQELFAIGVANAVGSCFSSFVSASSLSRSVLLATVC